VATDNELIEFKNLEIKQLEELKQKKKQEIEQA